MATIVLLGGGMSGYAAALAARRAGHRAILAEPRSFVGHELTATGHAWLRNGETRHELCTPVGAMKKYLLRALLDEGVEPLLLSTPCGLAFRKGRACGALVGNKFGLQCLQADHIVDTTRGAIAFPGARMPDTLHASFTFTVDQARTLYETTLPVPESLGLEGDAVFLHPSVLPNTMGIELRFEVRGGQTPDGRSRIELQAREKALAAFRHLRQSQERLAGIQLRSMAGEVFLQEAAQPSAAPAGVSRFAYAWPMSPSTREMERCLDAAKAFFEGIDLVPADGGPDELWLGGARVERFGLREEAGRPFGLRAVQLDWKALDLPVLEAQAVVAGMGTAGALAVEALLQEGIRTAVIEPFFQPGGTRTLGRVTHHYFGHVQGASRRMNEAVEGLSATLREKGTLGDATARMLRYQDLLRAEACLPLLGHIACGAWAENGRLAGVAAVSEEGLVCLKGQAFLDMTSDADVAAFAGVPYALGCPRDGSVMTNGQWGDTAWAASSFTDAPFHRDYDVVCNDSYADLLRAVLLAHGYNSDLDFSPLNTLRESRRIRGRHTLTLSDVLLHRAFDDCVAVACTPYDTHGRASSVLINMGMLHYDVNPLKVRIPYRCFLPEGLEGLLVGGKCLSATRDASSLCRMNADVENAGYALGLAAALAVAGGHDVSAVDVKALQARLRAAGCLPDFVESEAAGVEESLEALRKGDPEGLLYAILQPREAIVPRLREPDLAGRDAVAMARCWFGEAEGVDRVLELLDSTEDLADLLELVSEKGYGLKRIAFEGRIGAYHWINRYIALLGVAKDKRALPALVALTARAQAGGPPVTGEAPYHKHRMDTRVVPGFERIACLTFALERLADPSAQAALEELLQKPHVQGYVQPEALAGESFPSCAWLELCVARSLARCGGRLGYERLAEYTGDSRAVFALHAAQELSALTGEDFGMDPEAWQSWIKGQNAFACVPYEGPVQVD